jgi:transcriptional regulator with XRE-family HTH domain
MNKNTDNVAGKTLRKRREELGYSQTKMSRVAGISETFVSEIELGKKIPADEKFIYRIADGYQLESEYVFRLFNKVPTVVAGEISHHKNLADTLFSISNDKRLTGDQKEKLYEDFRRLYADTIGE